MSVTFQSAGYTVANKTDTVLTLMELKSGGILTLNFKNHKSIIRNSEKCYKENTEY